MASQRKRMNKGFEKFREMFRKTQQGIADGRRRVIDYSEIEYVLMHFILIKVCSFMWNVFMIKDRPNIQ